MSSNEDRAIGIEEARKNLGPIANRAHLAGDITYLTRNGTPIAAVAPLDRIKETNIEITEVTALVPVECSRATAATAWRAVAINLGFEVDIVGKDNHDNPLVKRGGDPFAVPDSGALYVLTQDDAGIVRAEPYKRPLTAYEEAEMEMEPVWNSCPADNCDYGDVALGEYPQEDGTVLEAGMCGSCTAESVKCPDCGTLTVLVWPSEETPCDGCDAVFQKETDRKGETEGFRRVR